MQNRWKMQKNIKNKLNYFIFPILIFILFSCSENQPEINQIFWQITKYHDVENNTYYDRLSLFMELADEDGVEDIKTIYIINDAEELFWKIEDKNWIYKTNNNENWFGSDNIVMNDFSGFPLGQYRALVLDDAGERRETTFNISSYDKKFQENQFPSAAIENNIISFSANSETIWFYNENMNFLNEINAANNSSKTMALPDKAKAIFLYRYDRINGYGLLSGPYKPAVPKN